MDLDKPITRNDIILTAQAVMFVGGIYILVKEVKESVRKHQEDKLDKEYKKKLKEAYDKKYPNGAL